MIFIILGWVGTISGMIGALLISRKQISGMYLFLISDFALEAVTFHTQLWSMGIMYIYFALISAYGIFYWNKTK